MEHRANPKSFFLYVDELIYYNIEFKFYLVIKVLMTMRDTQN